MRILRIPGKTNDTHGTTSEGKTAVITHGHLTYMQLSAVNDLIARL